MLLISVIKSHQLEARKLRNELEANLLTTLIGEADTIAKNSGQVMIGNPELEALIRKFLKGINFVLESPASEETKSKAQREKEILEAYLPQQLTKEEIAKIISDRIFNGDNKGKAMLYLKDNHKGQYDGKMASDVYEQLAKEQYK